MTEADWGPRDRLGKRWYASLEAGEPDYSVYSDPDYIEEVEACWRQYSRRHLASLARIIPDLGDITVVADLGCGDGRTTVALQGLFPAARVVGTNLPGPQTDAARARGVEVVGTLPPPCDIIFASEYFEHFQAPVDHLNEVFRATAEYPRVLVLANSFTAQAIGHFPTYEVDGVTVPANRVARLFNATLRAQGYVSRTTGFWNNRPAVWEREEDAWTL